MTDVRALAAQARELAMSGLQWLVEQGRETSGGLAWTTHPDDGELDPTLYSGAAGNVLTLLEAARDLDDERYADVARRAIGPLVAAVEATEHASLYFGRTGIAVALHALGHHLGEPTATAAAARALDLVEGAFDGERWNVQFELMGGNAGIGLGALAAGRRARRAGRVAVPAHERTDRRRRAVGGAPGDAGPVPPHLPRHPRYRLRAGRGRRRDGARRPGRARPARRRRRGEPGRGRPERLPGAALRPAAPARAHRALQLRLVPRAGGRRPGLPALSSITGDANWDALGDRCWHSVTHSGLPARLRPGFWDNSGRCCGTAGVLALATDRYAEGRPDLGFTRVLVDDLAERATIDEHGARWSNEEHRVTPSELPPRTGWAMGNAGIVRELLRLQRVLSGETVADVVPWPDEPAARRRARRARQDSNLRPTA